MAENPSPPSQWNPVSVIIATLCAFMFLAGAAGFQGGGDRELPAPILMGTAAIGAAIASRPPS